LPQAALSVHPEWLLSQPQHINIQSVLPLAGVIDIFFGQPPNDLQTQDAL